MVKLLILLIDFIVFHDALMFFINQYLLDFEWIVFMFNTESAARMAKKALKEQNYRK